MFKKVCAFAFALIMTLPTQMPVFAVETPENPNETILQQALEIDAEIDVQQSEDFQVISVNTGNAASRAADESFEEKAIQMTETNGEMVEVTTIIPYKMLPNGELVNSFTYQPIQTRASGDAITERFVDVTLTSTVYYAKYKHMYGSPIFYRHAGLEAYWSSNNSTATVSNMDVNFDSAGELYKYPDCLTDTSLNEVNSLVQSYYIITSTINQNNPVKNKVYIDGQHAMPNNRVLNFRDHLDHGGLVYMDISYSVNGKNYDQFCSHPVYLNDR